MFGVSYLAGGRLDPPFMPTKTKPWVKGDFIEFVAQSDSKLSKTLILQEPVEFLSVAGACSRYYPLDNWELVVNGEKIVESLYTKDLPEGIFFVATIPLNEGDTITFTFHNREGIPKYVWFNYQFLK